MPNVTALAVLGGVVSAFLFLSLSVGLPGMVVLTYFVQLPLLLVGLTLGVAPAVIAAVSGGAVSGVMAGGLAAASFAVVAALPALLVVRQSLLSRAAAGGVEWYPPGPVLAQLAAFAAAAIALAFLLFAGAEGGLVGAVRGLLDRATAEFAAAGTPGGAEVAAAVRRAAALFPGVTAASWLLMATVNAVLAQALAVRLGRNLRPSPDIAELSLPRWLMYLAGSAALLSLLGGGGLADFGRSLLLVLLVPYLLQGLAVAHAFARRLAAPRLALAALYAALVLLGWPVLLVAVLGLVEDWAQLRRRFT